MRVQIACALLLIAVAACDKKKDDKNEGEGSGSGSAEASGSGTASGSELASGTAVVAPTVDATPAPPPIPPGMTGDPVCDELIARQRCFFAAMGKNMPKQTVDAFEAGIDAWRTGLAEPATKDAIVASCKTSLDNGMEGYAQMKCGGPVADLPGATPPADATKTASAGGLPAGFTTTGAAECDELSVRTLCTYTKGAGSYPQSAIDTFLNGVDTWRKGIANDATRQPVIDGCKMSLDAGKDAFASAGCGGDLASLDITLPSGGGDTKAAATGGFQPFGEPTCDKMVERTLCAYAKIPGDSGAETTRRFLEGIESYRDLLANEQTRAAVIDGCRMALENGDQGYKLAGC